jgi:hypothetical protein
MFCMLLYNFVNVVFYFGRCTEHFLSHEIYPTNAHKQLFIVLVNSAADGHTGRTMAHT